MKKLLWLLPVAAVVGLDQLTKILTVANIQLGESVTVIPGVLDFTYIQNDGAAMGMLDNHRWIFMLISTVAIIAVCLFMFLPRFDKYYNPLLYTALGFIAGGGIGNMIDRIAMGYVVDFIDVKFIPFWHWIFNVADSFVCVGCGMVILHVILEDIVKAKKKQSGDSESPTEQ